jgi:SAM-dependent methyltransferase
MDKFEVDYRDTPFLRTSKTFANYNRLNWRCEILLTRNQDAIKGKNILDLASHDGRFSYACLRLGASRVMGVEGRKYLVEYARENLSNLGFNKQHFEFVHDDVFNYLPKIKPKEFDTILCFGFFYHTVRQSELFEQIKRIGAKYFILDTFIVRGGFFDAYLGVSTPLLLSRPNPIVEIGKLIRLPLQLKKNIEVVMNPNKGKPCLVFKVEEHTIEGATIDTTDLVAWPTKSYIDLVLQRYGFNFKQLYYDKREILDWTALEDYKTGMRISYFAKLATE